MWSVADIIECACQKSEASQAFTGISAYIAGSIINSIAIGVAEFGQWGGWGSSDRVLLGSGGAGR